MKSKKNLKRLISSLVLAFMSSFPVCAENIINISDLTKVIEQSKNRSEKNHELKKTLDNIDYRIRVLEKKVNTLKGEYLSIGEITSSEMFNISYIIYDLCYDELDTVYNILQLKLEDESVEKRLCDLKLPRQYDVWGNESRLVDAFLAKSRLYEIRNFVAELTGDALLEIPTSDGIQDVRAVCVDNKSTGQNVYKLDSLVKNIDYRIKVLNKKFYVLKKYLSADEITRYEQISLSSMLWELCDGELNNIWKILKINLDSDNMKRLTKSELKWISEKSKYDPENNDWSFSSYLKASDLTISRLCEILNFVSWLA